MTTEPFYLIASPRSNKRTNAILWRAYGETDTTIEGPMWVTSNIAIWKIRGDNNITLSLYEFVDELKVAVQLPDGRHKDMTQQDAFYILRMRLLHKVWTPWDGSKDDRPVPYPG